MASGLPEPPILACPEGALAQAARDGGLGVFELPHATLELKRSLRDRAAATRGIAQQAAALRALVGAQRPDVLLAWGMRSALVVTAAYPGGPSIPFLLQHHDLLPGPLVARAVRVAAARADRVVACSTCVAEDLDPAGTLGRRLEVVRPGVDLTHFRPAAETEAQERPQSTSEVLMLGAIERWKRPDLALEAFALAARELPELRLRIAGAPIGADGARLAAELRARAEQADLAGRVELCGAVSDPLSALRRAACLLHCAEREPYGLAVAEALACATPVVIPDSCGPAEIADRRCGRLYPPGDARAAAAALVALLTADVAPRVGQAGRAHAERILDARVARARYAELFEAVAPSAPVTSARGIQEPFRAGFAIVTVLHDSSRELAALLKSIGRHAPSAQVVIVDSGSSDRGIELVRNWGHGEASVVEMGHNVGFGRAVNAGLQEVCKPVTVLLNPDADLPDASLAAAAQEALRAPDRLIAPLVLRPGGSREDSAHREPGSRAMVGHALLPGAVLPASLAAVFEPWRSRRPRPAGWPVASCLVARTDVLRRLGPFDERAFMFAEDLDLGLRAADAGIQTWFWPAARVVHRGAHSTGRAFGGEPFDLLARRRRQVVRELRGPGRARLDDLFQLLTFADRAVLKRLLGRSADRERRQLAALIRAPRGRRLP